MAFKRLTMENYTYRDSEFMETGIAQFFNRLAAYEDTNLTPEAINTLAKSQIATAKHNVELQEELSELKQQIADSKLVEIPCTIEKALRYYTDMLNGLSSADAKEFMEAVEMINLLKPYGERRGNNGR